MDLYERLGVGPGASADELRQAYRRRARFLHPDRWVDAPHEVLARKARAMQEVNEAWNVLGHPGRRAPPAQACPAGTEGFHEPSLPQRLCLLLP